MELNKNNLSVADIVSSLPKGLRLGKVRFIGIENNHPFIILKLEDIHPYFLGRKIVQFEYAPEVLQLTQKLPLIVETDVYLYTNSITPEEAVKIGASLLDENQDKIFPCFYSQCFFKAEKHVEVGDGKSRPSFKGNFCNFHAGKIEASANFGNIPIKIETL